MTKRDRYADRPYEVGKGKPPKHTRFAPGQSGNPSGGRRPGRKAGDVSEFLSEKVTMRGKEGEKTVTRRDGLLHMLFGHASKGNVRAAELLLKLDSSDDAAAQMPASDTPEDPAALDDKEILRRFLDRQAARMRKRDDDAEGGEDA